MQQVQNNKLYWDYKISNKKYRTELIKVLYSENLLSFYTQKT